MKTLPNSKIAYYKAYSTGQMRRMWVSDVTDALPAVKVGGYFYMFPCDTKILRRSANTWIHLPL